jgi:PKD repeat protein
LTFSKSAAFKVTAGSGLVAGFTGTPLSGSAPLTVNFTDASTGTITSRSWDFGDGATSTATNPSHTYTSTGSFTVSLTVTGASGSNTLTRSGYVTVSAAGTPGGYMVVDTGQTQCYNATTTITAPASSEAFYGQDAQLYGNQPSYTKSADGLTVYDNNTGLTWMQSPDTNRDGSLTYADKLSWTQAQALPATFNAVSYGGYSDWRLPTIKEQYSLMDFRGTDPSGLSGSDTSGLTPFIDTNYFGFAYGFTSSGERIIDSQYASSTLYVGDASMLFGVNFADGRIKGYGLTLGGSDKKFCVQLVRGNTSYGLNNFTDNGDGTVTDSATGLMWTQADSGSGMNWQDALAWAQTKNAANYLGHGDWRLPNVKELQSIVDYTRSPATTSSAAINAVFSCTQITGENGQADYPWYWSGTTHADYSGSAAAGAYVCFGKGWGYMNSTWVDVHGAGCQRSDPKSGSFTSYTYAPYGYYHPIAPQGDGIRLLNYVRLVRGGNNSAVDHVGDGIPDWWRRQYFGGSGTTVTTESAASADPDDDTVTNYSEYLAGTHPLSGSSVFKIETISLDSGFTVFFQSVAGRRYTLYHATDLTSGAWTPVPSQIDVPGSGGVDSLTDPSPSGAQQFYRVGVRLP